MSVIVKSQLELDYFSSSRRIRNHEFFSKLLLRNILRFELAQLKSLAHCNCIGCFTGITKPFVSFFTLNERLQSLNVTYITVFFVLA